MFLNALQTLITRCSQWSPSTSYYEIFTIAPPPLSFLCMLYDYNVVSNHSPIILQTLQKSFCTFFRIAIFQDFAMLFSFGFQCYMVIVQRYIQCYAHFYNRISSFITSWYCVYKTSGQSQNCHEEVSLWNHPKFEKST